MKRLRLDEIEGIPVFGSLVWKPVRKTLGVTAFGINAYTAANVGDEVVEDHTESTLGHEGDFAAALDAWAGTENYEMRVAGIERIDPVVLEALRRTS